MELKDILKLIDAGYTREEIQKMEAAGKENAGNEPKKDQQQNQQQNAAGLSATEALNALIGRVDAALMDQSKKPEEKKDVPEESTEMKAINDLIERLDKKIDDLRAANIINQSVNSEDQNITTDKDVITQLVYPEMEKGEGK